MLDLMLAQAKIDDFRREVEKARLFAIANRSRKDQARKRLAELACRFGLIQTC